MGAFDSEKDQEDIDEVNQYKQFRLPPLREEDEAENVKANDESKTVWNSAARTITPLATHLDESKSKEIVTMVNT